MIKPKHTFFCQDIDSGYLSEEESKHAVRVLRLKNADHLYLMDGKGRKSLVEITEANKIKLIFKVLENKIEKEGNLSINIAIAPTKSMDRFSFFLEKVTEIGIQKISPFYSSNSERKEIKTEKLRRNLVSAIKQSGNLFLPEIEETVSFENFITELNQDSQKFIAHCEDDAEKKELRDIADTSKNIIILIGPEGDFSSEEINLAINKGFIPISLGNSRLRTETAGIVACHTLHVIS